MFTIFKDFECWLFIRDVSPDSEWNAFQLQSEALVLSALQIEFQSVDDEGSGLVVNSSQIATFKVTASTQDSSPMPAQKVQAYFIHFGDTSVKEKYDALVESTRRAAKVCDILFAWFL